VLVLDGGGVRGVIPLEFLRALETHCRHFQLVETFDLAVGTSAGESWPFPATVLRD
jgi:patatin-like phospholipase/acyl hydrolase